MAAAAAVTIATKIVVVAATAEGIEAMAVVAADVMTTAIAGILVMKTATIVPTGVAMTMDLAALTGTPLAAEMIATAAAEMIVAAEEATMIASVLAMVVMGTQRLLVKLASPMEVELSMTAQTIGTLVVKLRSANLLRCGALGQIMRQHYLQPAGQTCIKITIRASPLSNQLSCVSNYPHAQHCFFSYSFSGGCTTACLLCYQRLGLFSQKRLIGFVCF